ncbi:MAG TPA: 4-alpha-glucanotransferase [Candidatus Omnitrophota bacterium]|nr:4-alpha-glucanotransferase [Candidatus Omnitrophota bacterium]
MKETVTQDEYQSFLEMKAGRQWKRIGTRRRAGIATPLFSVYSAESVGIGELPDLKPLVDWTRSVGMSLIQLLPLNDVGFDFRPYDAQSNFALDPMYLSLGQLTGAEIGPFRKNIEALRKLFPINKEIVDYGIKQAKLELLAGIFLKQKTPGPAAFKKFKQQNLFWLGDYSLFKVIKEKYGQSSWEEWPADLKGRDPAALSRFEKENRGRIDFYAWLQWQLFEQFRDAKAYAASKAVLLMGDIPFLVSRDSADVWAHQDYFKLHLAAGAPPDLYFWKGQRWGMPPYHWENIARNHYDYVTEKLRYAENFYDLYRIDHFVGLFRLWTIPVNDSPENAGLNGVFDPRDESVWEHHGRTLLTVMVESNGMLPCAEDLGMVPPCSYRLLEEFAAPGMDVQRWVRDWGKTYDFKSPAGYRKNSIAVISTHDMHFLRGWWEFEAGTVDEGLFRRQCELKGIDFGKVKGELFDPKKSREGRLRWRRDLDDEGKLLSALGKRPDEIYEFLDAYRASFTEREKFWNYLGLSGKPEEKCSVELIRAALGRIHQSASIFSIQLLQDWLALDSSLNRDPVASRINFPGTTGDKNWRRVVPLSLEAMKGWELNKALKSMNKAAGRI